MKKRISILLIGVLCISLFSGCSKKETIPNWTIDNNSAEINTEEEIKEGEDLNLLGKLYTENNKPEGSEKIIIYDCIEHELKIEPHESYALKENINIQYLLDTINAYSAQGTFPMTGYVVGDVATVNINDVYMFLNWLQVDYPDEFNIYNKEKEGVTDLRYNAGTFSINALNVIDSTLKANLKVSTVIFKTNNDEDFLNIDEVNCAVHDGIYFNEYGYPRYIGSEYNYYGNMTYDELLEKLAQKNPDIKNMTGDRLLYEINHSIG